MTKDPNPGFFYFALFCEVCVCVWVGGGGVGSRQDSAGQGKGRFWQGSESNYFHK